VESLVKNIQFITLKLDNGNANGFFSKLIYQPLEEGRSIERQWQAAFNKRYKKAIRKHYGEKEFKNLGITRVQVPEFQGIDLLNNGDMTKLDLLVMASYVGEEGNRKRLENFGVSIDTIMDVLTREIGTQGFDFIQDFLGGVYGSSVQALQ